MSNSAVAFKCVCETPELGIVDGDTGTVYCKCEGSLGSIEDVIASPLNPTLQDPFWNEQLESRENAVVIEGVHYRIGSTPYPKKGYGFGGSHFRIKFLDGTVIDTCDLYHQGTVPAEYAEVLPDNAKFVKIIEVKQFRTCPNCGDEMNRDTCYKTTCNNVKTQ